MAWHHSRSAPAATPRLAMLRPPIVRTCGAMPRQEDDSDRHVVAAAAGQSFHRQPLRAHDGVLYRVLHQRYCVLIAAVGWAVRAQGCREGRGKVAAWHGRRGTRRPHTAGCPGNKPRPRSTAG